MVVGNRKETFDEVWRRHLNELIELYSGWGSEREYAIKIGDADHKLFCEKQLELYKSLLENSFNYVV